MYLSASKVEFKLSALTRFPWEGHPTVSGKGSSVGIVSDDASLGWPPHCPPASRGQQLLQDLVPHVLYQFSFAAETN